MKVKVDTRIEPKTLDLVLQEAKKQNRSKSQMLRIMIEDWFNNKK